MNSIVFKKYFVLFNCDSTERAEALQKYFITFGIYHFIEQTLLPTIWGGEKSENKLDLFSLNCEFSVI